MKWSIFCHYKGIYHTGLKALLFYGEILMGLKMINILIPLSLFG